MKTECSGQVFQEIFKSQSSWTFF